MTGKARMARYRRFIPVIFSVIIIGFVGKLWYDNAYLTERNNRLREQFLLANERNMKFADQMEPITKRLDSLAKTLDEETRRRSTAEARANSLQKENEFLRSSKSCSIAIDPSAVEKGKKDGNTVIIQAAPAGE
ncbi:hypothetical protein [Pantoea sp.]|uniref:hypothetical protein n=1 Tax=Pantoea sp. TaxID=69393 RepID=UPI002913B034|nr:hypothetical protein [Pantoea sp.]MDU4128643.1 hypothetical protein [Pantoea sp.]